MWIWGLKGLTAAKCSLTGSVNVLKTIIRYGNVPCNYSTQEFAWVQTSPISFVARGKGTSV